MKARSVVFTHVQWPFAVFGLPPKLLGASVGTGAVVYIVALTAGLVAVSFILLILAVAAGILVSYRLARKDRHIESLTLTSMGFWGVLPRRWLLAGAISSPRSGGRP